MLAKVSSDSEHFICEINLTHASFWNISTTNAWELRFTSMNCTANVHQLSRDSSKFKCLDGNVKVILSFNMSTHYLVKLETLLAGQVSQSPVLQTTKTDCFNFSVWFANTVCVDYSPCKYSRDGVSESQFNQVLNIELNQIIEVTTQTYILW